MFITTATLVGGPSMMVLWVVLVKSPTPLRVVDRHLKKREAERAVVFAKFSPEQVRHFQNRWNFQRFTGLARYNVLNRPPDESFITIKRQLRAKTPRLLTPKLPLPLAALSMLLYYGLLWGGVFVFMFGVLLALHV